MISFQHFYGHVTKFFMSLTEIIELHIQLFDFLTGRYITSMLPIFAWCLFLASFSRQRTTFGLTGNSCRVPSQWWPSVVRPSLDTIWSTAWAPLFLTVSSVCTRAGYFFGFADSRRYDSYLLGLRFRYPNSPISKWASPCGECLWFSRAFYSSCFHPTFHSGQFGF